MITFVMHLSPLQEVDACLLANTAPAPYWLELTRVTSITDGFRCGVLKAWAGASFLPGTCPTWPCSGSPARRLAAGRRLAFTAIINVVGTWPANLKEQNAHDRKLSPRTNGRRLTLTNDTAYHLVMNVAAGQLDAVDDIAAILQPATQPI
jgi:hypothetical protein